MSILGVNGGAYPNAWVSSSGSVLPSGNISDLGIEQVGFFKYNDLKPGEALTSPTYQTAPKFRLGYGYKRSRAEKNQFPRKGLSDTKVRLTDVLHGKNIIKWEGIAANDKAVGDIWALGYDGVDARKGFQVKYNQKALKIGVRIWGNPVRQLVGAPKTYWYEEFHVDKDFCIDNCADEVCSLVDQDKIVDNFLRDFNSRIWNPTTPFNKYVRATKIAKYEEEPTPPEGLVSFTKYCLSICDDGTTSSLGALQTQYAGFSVEFQKRSGAISTYEMWRPTGSGAPANAVISAPVAFELCGECPSGYTYVGEQNIAIVNRILTPSDNIVGGGNQQTYANTVRTAYVPVRTFNGTVAGVDVTDDEITVTAHGLPTGTPVVYSNGGGTSITGITSGNTYYVISVDANTVQLSLTPGGEAIDLTVVGTGTAHTLTVVTTATFLGSAGGNANIQITYPGVLNDLVAINSDTVTITGTSSASCIPPTTSVAWESCGTCNRAPKQWAITLSDTICGESRLDELQAAYPELVITEQSPVGTCARSYLTTTYSQCVGPDCYPDQYVWGSAPEPFESDIHWVEFVGAPLDEPDCTVPEVEPVCKAVGVIFEGATFYHNSTECTFGYYDFDPLDVEPVYINVSLFSTDYTEVIDCREDDIPVTKLQSATFRRGEGTWVRELERATLYYDGKIWTENASINEAYGVNFVAQPEMFYDEYRLTVRLDHTDNEIAGREFTQKDVAYSFFVPRGKGKSLEALFNPYVLSLGNPELGAVVL